MTPEIVAAIFSGMTVVIGAVATAIVTVNNGRQKRIEKETYSQSDKLHSLERNTNGMLTQLIEKARREGQTLGGVAYEIIPEGTLAAFGNDIKTMTASITRRLDIMDNQIQKMTDQVAESRTVIAGATALIGGISARIDAAVQQARNSGVSATDLAALTDLSANLKNSTDALASAVQQNTPAATGEDATDK